MGTSASIGTSTQRATRPYYPQLDGVRALATLMVMGFHFAQDQGTTGLAILGQTGVDLFFVLSGFLITTILLLSPSGDWHEVRTFYVRRTLRIFPLYYGYLLLATLLSAAPSWQFWVYLQNFAFAYAIPIVGPNHFWSLAVEEQFYLVQPFLVLFLPRRYLPGVLAGIVAIAVVSRFALLPTRISPFCFTPCRLDGLAAGALLAVFSAKLRLAWVRRALLAVAGLTALLVVLLYLKFHGGNVPWVLAARMTLITAFYAAAVGLIVPGSFARLDSLLTLRPLRAIGKVSYGLYVFHPAIFTFLMPHLRTLPTALRLGVCFTAAFAIASVSWLGFERYFLRLKDVLAPEGKPFRAAKVLT